MPVIWIFPDNAIRYSAFPPVSWIKWTALQRLPLISWLRFQRLWQGRLLHLVPLMAVARYEHLWEVSPQPALNQGVLSAAAIRKIEKSCVRPACIVGRFVFCSAVFRWISESVPVWRWEEDTFCKNRGNNEAISCNNRGRTQELHVVVRLRWTGLKHSVESEAWPWSHIS